MSEQQYDWTSLAGQAGLADQAAAGLEHLGACLVAYYRKMCDGGLPAEMAGQIVRDYHFLAIHRSMWPAVPPVTGPWEAKEG